MRIALMCLAVVLGSRVLALPLPQEELDLLEAKLGKPPAPGASTEFDAPTSKNKPGQSDDDDGKPTTHPKSSYSSLKVTISGDGADSAKTAGGLNEVHTSHYPPAVTFYPEGEVHKEPEKTSFSEEFKWKKATKENPHPDNRLLKNLAIGTAITLGAIGVGTAGLYETVGKKQDTKTSNPGSTAAGSPNSFPSIFKRHTLPLDMLD